MTFAELPVGQPFRIGEAKYQKIAHSTALRERDQTYVGIRSDAEVQVQPKPDSFSEQLESTGDAIERSFAEQLQDSGDKLSLSRDTRKNNQPNHD